MLTQNPRKKIEKAYNAALKLLPFILYQEGCEVIRENPYLQGVASGNSLIFWLPERPAST